MDDGLDDEDLDVDEGEDDNEVGGGGDDGSDAGDSWTRRALRDGADAAYQDCFLYLWLCT